MNSIWYQAARILQSGAEFESQFLRMVGYYGPAGAEELKAEAIELSLRTAMTPIEAMRHLHDDRQLKALGWRR